MDGFMPCPGRRPLTPDGLPSKKHTNNMNNVAGIHTQAAYCAKWRPGPGYMFLTPINGQILLLAPFLHILIVTQIKDGV